MKKKILLLAVLVMLALSACKGSYRSNGCTYYFREDYRNGRQYKVVCVRGAVPLIDTPQRTWLPMP